MPKVKDLNLNTMPNDGTVITENVNVCNVQCPSEGLKSITFIVSGNPERKLVFAFPDTLAPDEPYTAVINLPPKPVIVENAPELEPPVDIPLEPSEYTEPEPVSVKVQKKDSKGRFTKKGK